MTNPWDCCGDPFEARVLHFSVMRSGGTCAHWREHVHAVRRASILLSGLGKALPPTNVSGDTNDDAIMRRAKRKARVFGRRKTHADNS